MRSRLVVSLTVLMAVLMAVLGVAVPASADTYRVRPGDTLSGIARQHGLASADLQAANSLTDPNRLVAGRTLVIPPRQHVVQPGEVLSAIARRYGTSTTALTQLNGITNAHHVRAGQVLRITGSAPPRAARPAPAAPAPVPVAATSTYVVRPGEALSVLARRLGASTAELLRLNDLANPDHIRSGQVLVVPANGASSPAPAPAAAPAAGSASRYPGVPSGVLRSPERLALIPSFERWAAAYGLPVELLMALSWRESSWNNGAVSVAGAIGIGQLLPTTSAWMAGTILRLPRLNPSNADDNIRMSAAYLAWLQRQMGDRDLAIAAYFQGPNAVRIQGLLPVTQAYVTSIVALMPRFRPA